jgi:hypothetical protein
MFSYTAPAAQNTVLAGFSATSTYRKIPVWGIKNEKYAMRNNGRGIAKETEIYKEGGGGRS